MPRTLVLIGALALSMYGSFAGAQTATPPAAQPSQVAAAHSDEALTKAVYAALNADPDYYFRHVNVRVDKGVAKLSGYVDTGAAINRARKVAGKVPGVTSVSTNNLHLDNQLRR